MADLASSRAPYLLGGAFVLHRVVASMFTDSLQATAEVVCKAGTITWRIRRAKPTPEAQDPRNWGWRKCVRGPVQPNLEHPLTKPMAAKTIG